MLAQQAAGSGPARVRHSCGHVLAERAATVPRRLLSPALAALGLGAAVLHLGGWYEAARRSAVGPDGPQRFLAAPPETT